jgi:hypothetical protein
MMALRVRVWQAGTRYLCVDGSVNKNSEIGVGDAVDAVSGKLDLGVDEKDQMKKGELPGRTR